MEMLQKNEPRAVDWSVFRANLKNKKKQKENCQKMMKFRYEKVQKKEKKV